MAMVLAMLLAQAAATETFDLATFEVPAGKRVERSGSVEFSDAGPKMFCQFMVCRQIASVGDPAKDFDIEWAALVAKIYTVKEERKTGTTDWADGWILTLGAAPVSVKGVTDFVAILGVFTGHGVRVAVVINYSDDSLKPKIDKFLNSVRLAKPAAPVLPAPPEPTPPSSVKASEGKPALQGRVWYRYSSQYSNWRYNPTPMEINKLANEGHSRWQYRFEEDGSYEFKGEHFSMNRPKEFWFHEEKGSYTLSGDTLRLVPKEAWRILRDREGKHQAEPAEIAREEATYTLRFHFISATEIWNLILSPETGTETKRDGWWSPAPLFPKSYFYGAPPKK